MKKADEIKELRGLDKSELEKKISSYEEEVMKLRFRHGSGQLDATAQLKTVRRQIARAQTVLNQQLAQAE